jgi:neopullulanase
LNRHCRQSFEGAIVDVQTPDWVKRAIFYQIFPDRFARSSRMAHPRGIHFKPWGSDPAEQGFQGGDLYGVAEKLDYLADLGITAIYLNPIFASASNHRYHTFDYMVVDPLLGGNDALRFLLDQAHARNMRIVLDGVFNHASRGFWPFHHVLETGGDSPYIDWFTVSGWPLNPYPRTPHEATNYAAWWDLAALPKLNVANPGMRDYLLQVARYWIDFGIDGWRLDVPEEIDDIAFWRTFRTVVKEANPHAYIVGEIWHDATAWLQGDRFDAVMNYVFSRMAVSFFGAHTLRSGYRPGGYDLAPLSAKQFAKRVERMLALHQPAVTHAQLNLLDSHDTARLLWIVNEDESALRLCLLFQMTMPGAPCIYYGTEVGMTGGPDPDCRGAFPWDEPKIWNEDLLAFVRQITALRHSHEALSMGSYQTLLADRAIFAFQRDSVGESVVVIINSDTRSTTVDIAPALSPAGTPVTEGTRYQNLLDGAQHLQVQGGHLKAITIPARGAVLLYATMDAH